MVDNFLIRPRLTRSQFSGIRPYAIGLVAVIRCATVRLAGLVLEIDVGERLTVLVPDVLPRLTRAARPQSVQAISAAEGRVTNGAAENRGRNLRPPFRRAPCSLKRVIGDFAAQDLFVGLLDCLLIHDTDPSFPARGRLRLTLPSPSRDAEVA
jgi:hypothetical protein